MIVANLMPLAPSLILALGAVLFAILHRVRFSDRFAHVLGLAMAGLTLGTATLLWNLARRQTMDFTLGRWSPPAALNLELRVDLIAASFLIGGLLAAFSVVSQLDQRPQPERSMCLIGLLLAGVLFLAADLALLAVLWTALSVLTVAYFVTSGRSTASVDWLAFALSGAPLLVLVAAGASPTADPSVPNGWPTIAASALLGLIGAASAGLGPFHRLQASLPNEHASVLGDVAMPLVGFDLAVRAVTSPSLTSTVRAVPTGLISVLVLIGIFGIIEASDAARKAENFADIVRACSRAELALAFAALAPGTNTLISTSLFLVIVSTIARTIAVAEPTNWCGRLGLGSLAGFPPLTGFLGRWFLVTGALMAGSWPLGIGIAIGIFASSLGLWRGMARLKVGRPVLDQTTPTVGTLLLTGIVIGTALIPSRWLLNALLPNAALPGQPGPAPTVAILILGLVLVLVPVLAAAALVRYPEHVRRSMIRSRMVRPSASSLFAPAGALADLAVRFEDRYGLATGVLIAVGTILALVT